MTELKMLSAPDFQGCLEELRTRSADYSALLSGWPTGESFEALMGRLRRDTDPERPYFFGELSSGVKFAGDIRDFPSVLHALYADCNATLIGALKEDIGDRQGDVFDIGTNIGVVAASLALHLGTRGHVHAFEPSPATLKIAAATLALNGVTNVTLTESALSDVDGSIPFYATPGNSAIASANRHDFGFLNDWAEIVVPTRRIDTIVKDRNLNSISLIKIDVEGHEMSVLKGGLGTLQSLNPTVVYEYTPVAAQNHGWSEQESVDLLASARAFDLSALVEPPLDAMASGGRWVPFPLPDGLDDQVNVFARPRQVSY